MEQQSTLPGNSVTEPAADPPQFSLGALMFAVGSFSAALALGGICWRLPDDSGGGQRGLAFCLMMPVLLSFLGMGLGVICGQTIRTVVNDALMILAAIILVVIFFVI